MFGLSKNERMKSGPSRRLKGKIRKEKVKSVGRNVKAAGKKAAGYARHPVKTAVSVNRAADTFRETKGKHIGKVVKKDVRVARGVARDIHGMTPKVSVKSHRLHSVGRSNFSRPGISRMPKRKSISMW